MKSNQNQSADEQLGELLREAYPAQEPSPSFPGRLSGLGERSPAPLKWRRKRFVLLTSFALVAVVGAAAFKYLMGRPGEAAIGLIPSDATVVVTLDTNPSEQQLQTFMRIGQALKREHLADRFDDGMTKFCNQNPLAKEIRPYFTTSFALANWDALDGHKDHGVILIAVKDPIAVERIMAKYGHPASIGGTYAFDFDKEKPAFGEVVDSYAVFSNQEALLARIQRVYAGQETAVSSLPEYQAARSSLPTDANLMLFVSPVAMSGAGKTASAVGLNPFKGTRWMALSAAIREDGIAVNYRCPFDQTVFPRLRALNGLTELNPQMLRKMPEGAYGVIGASQVGKYWSLAEDTGDREHGAEKTRTDLLHFKEQTGISIDEDIVPALQGDLALAIYPGSGSDMKDLDGLLIADDANGADPAALAAKVRLMLERKSKDGDHALTFSSTTRGNTVIWRVDPETEARFQNGIKDDPSSPFRLRNKTGIYATIGNSLIIASSEAMLTRAIEAYQGHGRTLADDPAFATMQAKVTEGAQTMAMVDLHRVLEALRPVLERNHKPGDPEVADILEVFGDQSQGLVGSGRYDGQIVTGNLFLPLDYDRLIHVVGQQAMKDQAKQAAGASAK